MIHLAAIDFFRKSSALVIIGSEQILEDFYTNWLSLCNSSNGIIMTFVEFIRWGQGKKLVSLLLTWYWTCLFLSPDSY